MIESDRARGTNRLWSDFKESAQVSVAYTIFSRFIAELG
jgi:hypothetical protein